MVTPSIIKTALDALVAKWSALSVGYRPIPENGESVYLRLLECMCPDDCRRIQSPLVNAGYASRLSIIASIVYDFRQYFAGQPIQLVLLGSGLDILGLWAHSLGSTNLKVYEADTPEICKMKRRVLLEKGLISQIDLQVPDSAVLTGQITGATAVNGANYFLFDCDLRKPKTLENLLSAIDKGEPCLVLSELVLTYVGRESLDDLLRWTAANLCANRWCALVAFEALGPRKSSFRSVLEGYKEQYCQAFVEKLSCGLAKFQSEELFYPLGCDTVSVENRLSRSGFDVAFCSLAGEALSVRQTPLHSPEPFDEHAALALNLGSYALVIGYKPNAELSLVRRLSPWSWVARHDFTRVTVEEDNYLIRSIDAEDQKSVRSLYLDLYEGLYRDYPSVKKMVKSALKTDLRVGEDDEAKGFSSIGTRFGLSGGTFVVVVDKESGSLVGCAGLKRCFQYEISCDSGNTFESDNIYEIHRLAVKEEFRGKGLGSKLLEALEQFLAKEIGQHQTYKIIATTPAILAAANSLYQSSGYALTERQTFGKIEINSYIKLGVSA